MTSRRDYRGANGLTAGISKRISKTDVSVLKITVSRLPNNIKVSHKEQFSQLETITRAAEKERGQVLEMAKLHFVDTGSDVAVYAGQAVKGQAMNNE